MLAPAPLSSPRTLSGSPGRRPRAGGVHLPRLAAGLARPVTFPLRHRACPPRPAGKAVERPIRAAASAGQGWWDGILPDCWLLVEWPEDAEAPTDYWLSSLPAGTPIAELVRLAKVRWRIEHDYANSSTAWA
ncbi:hypothetical protein SAMN05421870_1312 [Streptomyces qinglanensis]|uniref:Transposase IS701-like DDE domain-containing protein n=1 Tax=Streptomyces qinglanensis TaxID=943816 RepID=A0A1H9WYK5_9ACTN|nr:hypothetical protein SAMN05421870_1312 [Streptomyces qinglanensis]